MTMAKSAEAAANAAAVDAVVAATVIVKRMAKALKRPVKPQATKQHLLKQPKRASSPKRPAVHAVAARRPKRLKLLLKSQRLLLKKQQPRKRPPSPKAEDAEKPKLLPKWLKRLHLQRLPLRKSLPSQKAVAAPRQSQLKSQLPQLRLLRNPKAVAKRPLPLRAKPQRPMTANRPTARHAKAGGHALLGKIKAPFER
jgi:hypothetical protein